MPQNIDIDALYEKALSLEAYASTLTDRAEAARIALALAIRVQGKEFYAQRLEEALKALEAIDPAFAYAAARHADLVAEKKK